MKGDSGLGSGPRIARLLGVDEEFIDLSNNSFDRMVMKVRIGSFNKVEQARVALGLLPSRLCR